jgi:hypothetical protein
MQWCSRQEAVAATTTGVAATPGAANQDDKIKGVNVSQLILSSSLHAAC